MRDMALLLATISALAATSAFAQQSFGGYDCGGDCAGHKAGYEWAEENHISDAADCMGNSQPFNEGCEAYTENPDRGADADDDGIDIDG